MAIDAKAVEALQQALCLETDGHSFYLRAADKTQDAAGKDMFLTLAKDEELHLKLVRGQYQSLKESGDWAANPPLKTRPVDTSKPLFPRGKQAVAQMIKEDFTEQDALLFGLDIESRSYNLYWEQAQKVTSAQGKEMYMFLVGEERTHFDTLMMRYELIAGPQAWTS